MLKIVQSVNNCVSVSRETVPLYYKDFQIGYCMPAVSALIRDNHSDKFICTSHKLVVKDPNTLHQLLEEWRRAFIFPCLQGWRDEKYPIYIANKNQIGTLERSGCGLFGISTYGVHVNGYTTENGDVKMWIARRSISKQTWPGYLDQMVAGGIPAGQSKFDSVIRECQEEANVPLDISKKSKAAGMVSYFMLSDIGFCPETQYCYDLHLPNDFVPAPNDGEVDSFQLLSLVEIRMLILENKFKPNCALVIVDFMIRHGFIDPDEEPDYEKIVLSLRRPLDLNK
eukprot:NODE_296_length_11478_cov_0.345197.p4 type:complete len:283 gc:universal NODE_296_length_11478_cov_0.345197:1131-283(-)